MAKAKKTKKEVKIKDQSEQIPQLGNITISQKRYAECEWCFQFDEDVPQIFAWTDPEMNRDENPKVIFEITNVENSYISFTSTETGKTFKIFARELTKDGEAMRGKQKEAFKNLKNGSENKEA
jgi:hypothetical protein